MALQGGIDLHRMVVINSRSMAWRRHVDSSQRGDGDWTVETNRGSQSLLDRGSQSLLDRGSQSLLDRGSRLT